MLRQRMIDAASNSCAAMVAEIQSIHRKYTDTPYDSKSVFTNKFLLDDIFALCTRGNFLTSDFINFFSAPINNQDGVALVGNSLTYRTRRQALHADALAHLDTTRNIWFFPMNHNDWHWFSIWVNFEEKVVYFYDSLPADR